ncbi:cryptococcal mannosyltransferase 1-domain-containing protein [Coprinopsis sp. MPI-PUGE-AT-0042]|nr:cryptococcal mannosyltransferase 1-domain-containing protein [Coprinopsis sp. MPI-PUGE-AT-0042]
MLPIFKPQTWARWRRRQRRLVKFSLAAFLVHIFWPRHLNIGTNLEHERHQYFIDPSRIGRVFIAANHYDSEHILESHWIPAVLALIQILGRENVFVSIAASRSSDNTLSVLWYFDQLLGQMGVERKIKLEEETHDKWVTRRPEMGDTGWVVTPVGNHKWRRIPFLASVRNQVLGPLDDPQVVNATRGFDKLLFLNDIIFTAHDALALLNTRGGDYGAVCALDFVPDRVFYDSFVMRDSRHRRVASQARYPYVGSGPTRDALLRGHPAPVTSCWNGMAAFDAKPFLSLDKPLRFRAINDTLAQRHVEASECCLIHADNPESQRRGVWVNPQVRVAYNEDVYLRMRSWPTFKDKFLGSWLNLWNDFSGMPWSKPEITSAITEWLGEDPTRRDSEPGLFCLEDEMQILTAKSWQIVRKPKGRRLQWKQDP